LSPALVAEYQTRLTDKKLLQAKLHEFYVLAESNTWADGHSEFVPQPGAQLAAAKKPRKTRKK